MRWLHLWLAVYFVLVAGAGLSLWQAGVLARLGWVWSLAAAAVSIGLGLLLGATARRPSVSAR